MAEAIDLLKKVSFIHKEGGFFIRNFKSNSKAVLKGVGELEESTSKPIALKNLEVDMEKVLGM